MRQTSLFSKTLKEVPVGEVSLNSQLLIRAGFIDKTMAGVYTYLPLGWRVLVKIENIIREEMNAIGGQEILMPALSPQWNWEKTKRLEKVDVLFKADGANQASRKQNNSVYILNSTHEEIITPIMKKYASSYKDLPVAVYQIQVKYRNEPRPKAGLLRGREFRMKDLYSFHKNQEDLYKFYELTKKAYAKIFERMDIGNDTFIALASGGDFTKNYSHEFQTKCENGEDTVFKDLDSGICYNQEVAPGRVSLENGEEDLQVLEKVATTGIKTIAKLTEFLGIPKEKAVKTLLYKDEEGNFIAAALRGDYDINEEKLFRIIGFKGFRFADEGEIEKITSAKSGYSGLIGLSEDIDIYMDDSLQGLKNFAIGANETNYHYNNVNFGQDISEPEKFYDIKEIKPGDISPDSGKVYEVFKASETGNIFPLNTKFSESFSCYYDDENGNKKPIYMGAYGMGPTRIMGVLAEKFADEKGLSWTESVAPFKVHLLQLPGKNKQVKKQAEYIYRKLKDKNIQVLYDDRQDVGAGEKFADADLIGCPYRIVVSEKMIKENKIELKKRNENQERALNLEELIPEIIN